MKHFFKYIIIPLSIFLFTATSPIPEYRPFGGMIFQKNLSSYNLYAEFEIIDNPKGGFYHNNRLCFEKNDVIVLHHSFWVRIAEENNFDRNTADPNNYFKKIQIYDADTGTLLQEFFAGDILFTMASGSIEYNNAVFNLVFTDLLLSGGN